jgi:hypothetical protein
LAGFGSREWRAPVLHFREVALEGTLASIHPILGIAWINLPVVGHPLQIEEDLTAQISYWLGSSFGMFLGNNDWLGT